MSVVTVVREVQESQQNIMIRLHIIVSLCRSAIDRRAGNHGSWAELPIFFGLRTGEGFPPFPLNPVVRQYSAIETQQLNAEPSCWCLLLLVLHSLLGDMLADG
jgi:hypothetical protein